MEYDKNYFNQLSNICVLHPSFSVYGEWDVWVT
jgi:hypothetical protein